MLPGLRKYQDVKSLSLCRLHPCFAVDSSALEFDMIPMTGDYGANGITFSGVSEWSAVSISRGNSNWLNGRGYLDLRRVCFQWCHSVSSDLSR
jgi:hypothetical protein